MRLLWIFLGMAMLVLIPFLIWGGRIEGALSQSGSVEWMNHFGQWAWAAGILLLISDLVLPIPGTAVMAGLGYIYGPILGGLISATGSFLSGALAYGVCRGIGRRAALWLLGEKDLARGHQLFSESGGWLVALSRWMPVLTEVIACMAGLTRMPALTYFTALACGSLPIGFAFALIGSTGIKHPWVAITLSVALPLLLWACIGRKLRKRYDSVPDPKQDPKEK